MAKLTLELDALRVDSFDTSPAAANRRGTVRGHADAEGWAEAGEVERTRASVDGAASCDADVATCGDTCTDRCHTLPATCLTCTLEVCCPAPAGAGGL